MLYYNLIEVYLPDRMRTPKGVVKILDSTFDKVYKEVRDILLSSCTGCSEREEVGYFKDSGQVYKMKNKVLYAYFTDDVRFNIEHIHNLINKELGQECSMVCVNRVADIQ